MQKAVCSPAVKYLFIFFLIFFHKVHQVYAQNSDSISLQTKIANDELFEKNQSAQIFQPSKNDQSAIVPERIIGSYTVFNHNYLIQTDSLSEIYYNFICSNAVGCQNPDFQLAYYSSTNSGYTISDQFVPLTAVPITSVCWYGVYFNSNLGVDCNPGPGDDFRITYLYDNEGEPGDTLAGPFSVNPLKALTGNFLLGSVAVFGYETTHPSVNVTPHQLYWISIKNNILTGDCRWGWVSSSQGDSIHFLNGSFVQSDDLSFCLNVPIKPDGGISAAPVNDICLNSIAITVDTLINTSTVNATFQDAPAYCYTPLNTGPGLWYHFSGTGRKVELTTCNQGTNFDTKLAVFTGTCNNLTCIAGNDDMGSSACSFSPDHSRVTFCTDSLAEYYIYITGYGQNSGNVILVLNTIISDPPVFIQCPQDIIQNNNPGVCEAYVNVPEPQQGIVFSDDCGAIIYNNINLTNNASGIYPVATNQVIWTIEDTDGQTATCVQNITVVDVDNPIIICPADTIVETDAGSSFATGVTFETPFISDNCGILSVTHDGVEPYPVGTTIITWTVADINGNTESCNQALDVTPYVGFEETEILSDFLTIMPNPVSEQMEVKVGLLQNTYVLLEISDVIGNKKNIIVKENMMLKGVYRFNILSENLGLANGIYFITLTTERGQISAKIIFN